MAKKLFPWFDEFLLSALEDGWISRKERQTLQKLLRQHAPDAGRIAQIRRALFVRAKAEIDDDDARQVVGALEICLRAFSSYETSAKKAAHSQTLFFPSRSSLKQLIRVLERAQKSLDICVFTITDNRIIAALDYLLHKGVHIRIISDDEKAHDTGSDIFSLRDKGVDVRTDRSPYHMHNKFAVLDEELVITGSYNWTRSAADKNRENVLITDENDAVHSYRHEFQKLWREFA